MSLDGCPQTIELDLFATRLARDAAEHANVLKEGFVKIQQGHRQITSRLRLRTPAPSCRDLRQNPKPLHRASA